MSSRNVEDDHVMKIRKLFSKSGLECVRLMSESSASSTITAEIEELLEEEYNIKEESIEPEIVPEIPEEIEEENEIFPTASLRKILPENIRKIEEHNRIHVLPEKFNTSFDPMAIPKIASTASQVYIDVLANITGCAQYKSSLAEYWFLDTLANLLRRAQADGLDKSSQAALISWFCEWIKEMQHFDAADRQRMIKRFKDNMTSATRFIVEHNRLPTPKEAGVYYEAQEAVVNETMSKKDQGIKPSVVFDGFECALIDLTHIAHYIFDLFSTDYQYNLVRSIFTFTPEYTLIDTPYQMRNPKKMYAPSKPREKSPKKDKPKGKKKEVESDEYIALLELRAREERELEEKEVKDREEWQRRSHILPLRFTAGDEFFNKYWPPPEVPSSEPETRKKDKTKRTKK